MTNANTAERAGTPSRVSLHRHRSPYTWRVQLGRLLWTCCQRTLFRFSPRPAYRWRRWLLHLFGANIHPTARLHPTVRIEQPWNMTFGPNATVGDAAILYALGSIQIGARATISQFAHLCAGSHDYQLADMPLTRQPIIIGDDAWVAADGFVGPGVTVGEGAILGARGVASRDLLAWTIYAGNPASAIKPRPPLTARVDGDRSPSECAGDGLNAVAAPQELKAVQPESRAAEQEPNAAQRDHEGPLRQEIES